MFTIYVFSAGAIIAALIMYGVHLVRQDNKDDYYDALTPDEQEAWERLSDDSQDTLSELIRPHHLRADFLDIWEANWNREAIRIRFDTLRFHMEVLAEAAMWQLEIEKGVNISATA